MAYTILHQTMNSESLHQADSVSVSISDDTGFRTVWAHREGGTCSMDAGDVFVMNERGATIATYRLGDPRADQKPDLVAQNLETIAAAGEPRA